MDLNRRKTIKLAFISLLLLKCGDLFAKERNRLLGLRIWPSEEYTRLTIETSKKISFKRRYDSKTNRLIVQFKGVSIKNENNIKKAISNSKYIKSISINTVGNLVNIDYVFKKKVDINIFDIDPVGKYGNRLVIDVKAIDVKKVSKKKQKLFVVALDPGHGGEDPGAIGARGTYEKKITLEVAQKLKKKINKMPGYKAFLTRDGDYFISLYDRVEKAIKKEADIFISIHADSAENGSAEGGSVYVLSEIGASSATSKWLQDKENLSDLIGGVNMNKKNKTLRKTIINMLFSSNIKDSKKLAENILYKMKSIGELHKEDVESAEFAVLKAPNIPSVLIETAFISNPKEEKKLKNYVYQDRLTDAILNGITEFKNKKRI